MGLMTTESASVQEGLLTPDKRQYFMMFVPILNLCPDMVHRERQ